MNLRFLICFEFRVSNLNFMQLPSLGGNWVDFVVVAFIIFFIWDMWGRGFITSVIELITFAGAFIGALKLYPIASKLLIDNFSFPKGLANAAGFLLLGIVLEQLISFVGGKINEKIPHSWHKHPLNKVLSLFPLLVNAVIIVAFLLVIILSLPLRFDIKNSISDSKMAGVISTKTQSFERTITTIFGAAISETINFITISPVSHDEIKLNFFQKELTIDEGSEAEMFTRVNKERRDRGLTELMLDIKLRDLARVYAKDMFERGYFSHYSPEGKSPFNRMQEVGISYRSAGENLALAPNITIAHQGLMDSPGHRANILSSDFGKAGIGVIDGGIYGKMFVQEFTD